MTRQQKQGSGKDAWIGGASIVNKRSRRKEEEEVGVCAKKTIGYIKDRRKMYKVRKTESPRQRLQCSCNSKDISTA